MIEPSFRKILSASRPVADLVDDRIYFNVRPQDERRPCLVLTRVSTIYARTFGGPPGFERGRMQVDVFAPDYRTAKELTRAVRNTIDGYSGPGDTTGFEIDYIDVEDERDIHVEPHTGKSLPTYGVTVDARFMFRDETN